MVQKSNPESPLFLGVDGGGSKCRAVLVDSAGKVLGEGLGGPANPFHGVEQCLQSIGTATNEALAQAGMAPEASQQLIACLGLAGVNLPALHEAFMRWQHPYGGMVVAHDLHVACVAAHQGGDGAVIIAGTGSCGYSNVGGQHAAFGAYGFPHGDQGSGGWTGLQAVSHVLLALDGFAEPTRMTERFLAQLEASDATTLVERLSVVGVRGYAALAPIVFELANAGDAPATRIVREGAAYISQLARRLLQSRPPRLSMIGGLAPLIVPWLDRDVREHLSPPLESPEMGAVREAMRWWREQARH